jgi:hypothetical protein
MKHGPCLINMTNNNRISTWNILQGLTRLFNEIVPLRRTSISHITSIISIQTKHRSPCVAFLSCKSFFVDVLYVRDTRRTCLANTKTVEVDKYFIDKCQLLIYNAVGLFKSNYLYIKYSRLAVNDINKS